MHIKRSVVLKTTEETSPPFVIPPDINSDVVYDTETTPPIETDVDGVFRGRSSPRVLQRLFDSLYNPIG